MGAYRPPPFPIQTPVAASFRPTPPPIPTPIDQGPTTARAWQQAGQIVQKAGEIGGKAYQDYAKIKDVKQKKAVAINAFVETFGDETKYPELAKSINTPEFREKADGMTLTQIESSIRNYGKAANYYKQMKGSYPEEGKTLKIIKPEFSPYFDGNDWVSKLGTRFKVEEGRIKTKKTELVAAEKKDLIGLVQQQIAAVATDMKSYPNQEAVRAELSLIDGLDQVIGDPNVKAMFENAVKSRTKTDVPHTTFSFGTRTGGGKDRPPGPPKGAVTYKDVFKSNDNMVKELPKMKVRIESLKERQKRAKTGFGLFTPQEEGDLKVAQAEFQTLQKQQKLYAKVLKKVNETFDPKTGLNTMSVMEALSIIQKEEGTKGVPEGFDFTAYDPLAQQQPSPFQGVGPLRSFGDQGAPQPITAPPPQQQVASGPMF